jgi:hypothetical protein
MGSVPKVFSRRTLGEFEDASYVERGALKNG